MVYKSAFLSEASNQNPTFIEVCKRKEPACQNDSPKSEVPRGCLPSQRRSDCSEVFGADSTHQRIKKGHVKEKKRVFGLAREKHPGCKRLASLPLLVF